MRKAARQVTDFIPGIKVRGTLTLIMDDEASGQMFNPIVTVMMRFRIGDQA